MCIVEIKCTGLRFFYCFTGCDQFSFLANVSKKIAWKIWDVFPNVNKAFATLSNHTTDNDIHEAMSILKRFVILLYHQTSNCTSVNECRRELFCNGRACDNIPPTQAAFPQHVKRAAYMAGYVWPNALYPMQELPFFGDWGWKDNGKPHGTDLPEASGGVRMLLKCRCEKGCSNSCTCVQLF